MSHKQGPWCWQLCQVTNCKFCQHRSCQKYFKQGNLRWKKLLSSVKPANTNRQQRNTLAKSCSLLVWICQVICTNSFQPLHYLQTGLDDNSIKHKELGLLPDWMTTFLNRITVIPPKRFLSWISLVILWTSALKDKWFLKKGSFQIQEVIFTFHICGENLKILLSNKW